LFNGEHYTAFDTLAQNLTKAADNLYFFFLNYKYMIASLFAKMAEYASVSKIENFVSLHRQFLSEPDGRGLGEKVKKRFY
jgi:hypothetical protein